MSNIMRNRKKKGFTLIEMVAVVAIIGILAAILVPKITGYMKEAKKTGVIDQARKITQAFETAKMKDKLTVGSVTISESTEIKSLNNPTMLSLLDVTSHTQVAGILDKLTETTTVGQCIKIVAREEFRMTDTGVFDETSIAK